MRATDDGPNYHPPTHNREPYDTQLSDTISTDPSVEPMPFSSTRFMRMSVCGVRAPPHGPRTVRAGAPRAVLDPLFPQRDAVAATFQ